MTKPKSQQRPAAPAVHVAPSAKRVTVASKLPMNLELQLCTPKESRVTGQFGSTTETVMVKMGQVAIIRGTGKPEGSLPKGYKAPTVNDAGFALTPGIDAEFFRAWMEQNKDTDLVRNGLIQAHHDADSLDDQTADHAKLSSGLGPIDPDGDPRSPKPLNSAIQPIKEAELT